MPESNQKMAAFNAAQEAYQAQVVQPAFFDRLAERGYVPQDEKQAAAFLHMGLDLVHRVEEHEIKKAAARAPQINQGYLDYCRLVGIEPVVDFADSGSEQAIKRASENPEVIGLASRVIESIVALDSGE